MKSLAPRNLSIELSRNQELFGERCFAVSFIIVKKWKAPKLHYRELAKQIMALFTRKGFLVVV